MNFAVCVIKVTDASGSLIVFAGLWSDVMNNASAAIRTSYLRKPPGQGQMITLLCRASDVIRRFLFGGRIYEYHLAKTEPVPDNLHRE